MQYPLFPLNLVIFPEGLLPLRIFEPRYLDMVRNSARSQSEFIICHLNENQNFDKAVSQYWVGTACEIVDFETLPDGLLGITARGTRRVKISHITRADNQLLHGHVETIEEEPDHDLPDDFIEWSKMIPLIMKKMGAPYDSQVTKPDSAQWVSARLTELLPFDLEHKQRILEIDYPHIRLEYLKDILQEAEYYTSKGNLS